MTGSCSLIESETARFLVDCGLYQGNRSVRELNDRPFPFDFADELPCDEYTYSRTRLSAALVPQVRVTLCH